MACCGRSDTGEPKGIVKQRHCRDVLCLLLFGVFWAGMGLVAYEAFRLGDPKRIVYGLDSFGNYCGVKNVRSNGTVVDLTHAKKLYYMNPMELLDSANYRYARSVCIEECPGNSTQCSPDSFPCTQSEQYVCPYYNYSSFMDGDRLGVLSEGGATKGLLATNWWGSLPNYAGTQCTDSDMLKTIPNSILTAMNASKGCGYYYQTTSMYPGKGPCHAAYFATEDFMHRCYPVIPKAYYGMISKASTTLLSGAVSNTSQSALASKVVDNVASMSSSGFSVYVTDAQRGFVVIMVAGLASSLILSLVYMVILRFFAGVMAWLTIFLINALAASVTVLCAHKAGLLGAVSGAIGASLSDHLVSATGGSLTGDQQKVLKIITYVMIAVTVIIFLLTLLMIKRIKIAVACIKVAANAVATMPSLLLFPLVTFVSFVGLFVYWVIVFTYLWSAGDVVETYRAAAPKSTYTLNTLYNSTGLDSTFLNPPSAPPPPPLGLNSAVPCYDNENCYYSVQFNERTQYLFAYHIFGLLWTNQFIMGFGYVVIAGAIAQYYWHRGLRSEMPKRPVLLAVRNAAVYHMGSIAFGAFIVAVVQFVRLLLEYIDRKTKKMQQGNPAAKYLEKVMKFINRNAYIMVAVKGTAYCPSALRAVKLIVCNALALSAVNVIGDALIFLGKLSVIAGATVIAFLLTDMERYTDPSSDTYLSSPIIPVVLSAFAAYVVANIFFSVYEMAVDTVLLSFCEDREVNNGVPQFAPKLLMSAIGKAHAFEQQNEQRKSQAVASVGGAHKGGQVVVPSG